MFNDDAATAPKGFGRRGYRFKTSGSEVPGPGQYGRAGAGMESCLKRPSLSKKGYGAGFASQAERFNGGDAAPLGPAAPGPGAYGKTGVASDAYTIPATSAAGSAFRKHDNASVVQRSEPMPGPGAYDPGSRSAPQPFNQSLNSAQFRSSSKRFGSAAAAARTATAPGPGSYEHESALAGQVDMLAASLPTAAFRSRSGRGGEAAPATRAEHFPMDPQFGYNGMDRKEGREKVESVGRPEAKPGPGAYNPKGGIGGAMQFSMDAQRKSSMFSNDKVTNLFIHTNSCREILTLRFRVFVVAQLDRFGRSVVGELRAQAHDPSPGPGHYTLSLGEGEAVASPQKKAPRARQVRTTQKPTREFRSWTQSIRETLPPDRTTTVSSPALSCASSVG